MILNINKKAICVTNDFILGCIISSYFNQNNKYFSVFFLPKISKKEEDDSLVAQTISNYHNVFIYNRIDFISPDIVIFAGIDSEQLSYFSNIKNKIIINDIKDIYVKLNGLGIHLNGTVECNTKNILEALFIAKKENKKIIINNSIDTVFNLKNENAKGILIIEKNFSIDVLACVNYAFSINFDISFIRKSNSVEINNLKNLFFDNSTNNRKKISKCINKKINKVNFDGYKYITFVTLGIPYGFICDNKFEVTHLLLKSCNYTIFDSIYFSNNNKYINKSCVVFSPNFILPEDKEETDFIINKFKTKKYFVVSKIEKDATTRNFQEYIQNFPYDFLHICSHSGYINEGCYVIFKFKDRKNKNHEVRYWEIPTFDISRRVDKKNQPLVAVVIMEVFDKIDNIDWNKRNKIKRYVFEDFDKIFLSKNKLKYKGLIRVPVKGKIIPYSRKIECVDFMNLCQFHYLATGFNPIIFSNSCLSGFDLAKNFINFGARGFVGTLFNIGAKTASTCAKMFYSDIFDNNKTISEAVNSMNKGIQLEQYKNIYIFWGCHFLFHNKIKEDTKDKIVRRLISYSKSMYDKSVDVVNSSDIRQNYKDIIDIVDDILINNFELKDLFEK